MCGWIKIGDTSSVEEVVLKKTGTSVEGLLAPRLEAPYEIDGMEDAVERVLRAVKARRRISIVGDYDSDGMNATAILVRLLRFLGIEPTTIIPRRMSDGYGISSSLLDRIPDGLVITVDNGIAAAEPIAELKRRGCEVIVMDHHLPTDVLPPADVIIDPHIDPMKNGYIDYCGAGLSYQMARAILTQHHGPEAVRLHRDLTVHAAIATVTDVMPLLGGNRRIVKDGIELLNTELGCLAPGLSMLCRATQVEKFDTDSISFKIGPMINATARLYNAGGTSILKALICDDPGLASTYAMKMASINEERKALVQRYLADIEHDIEASSPQARRRALVVVHPGIPEGIIGIVAGNLCERYKVPAFVFTQSIGRAEVFKGSGRAGRFGDLTLALEKIRAHCVACGGHAGAAGLTVEVSKMALVTDLIHDSIGDVPEQTIDQMSYDLEITEDLIPTAYQDLQRFAPYGEGIPKPRFLVRGFQAVPRFGEMARIIGKDASSVKFNGAQCDAIAFGMAKRYAELGSPMTMDLLCTIDDNTYRGRTSIQLCVQGMRASDR